MKFKSGDVLVANEKSLLKMMPPGWKCVVVNTGAFDTVDVVEHFVYTHDLNWLLGFNLFINIPSAYFDPPEDDMNSIW